MVQLVVSNILIYMYFFYMYIYYITSTTIYLQYTLVVSVVCFFVNYKVVGFDVGLCCHILLMCPTFGHGTCLVGQTSGLAWTPWGSEL